MDDGSVSAMSAMAELPGGVLVPVELLTEDMRSLGESCPYFIRPSEQSDPIRCECCGTQVALTPEALVADGPGRQYRPAIWEYETFRRHTMRRCEWRRANPGPHPGEPVALG